MVNFNFNNSEIKETLNFTLDVPTNFYFTEEDIWTSTEYDFIFGNWVYNRELSRGVGNYFNSIWADPKASLTNGRFYITRETDLTIINTKNGQAVTEFYQEVDQLKISGDPDTYVDMVVK